MSEKLVAISLRDNKCIIIKDVNGEVTVKCKPDGYVNLGILNVVKHDYLHNLDVLMHPKYTAFIQEVIDAQ